MVSPSMSGIVVGFLAALQASQFQSSLCACFWPLRVLLVHLLWKCLVHCRHVALGAPLLILPAHSLNLLVGSVSWFCRRRGGCCRWLVSHIRQSQSCLLPPLHLMCPSLLQAAHLILLWPLLMSPAQVAHVACSRLLGCWGWLRCSFAGGAFPIF